MLSALPSAVQNQVGELLCARFRGEVVLKNFSFSGGGCINHGGCLETSVGNFFLKWNDSKKFPGMFEAEAKGLQLLSHANVISIPGVTGCGESERHQFLVLEFIESKPKKKTYWNDLGYALAALHKNTQENFGLDHSNYIGSLVQPNKLTHRWIDFFIEQRLDVQLKAAVDNHLADSTLVKTFEGLYPKFSSLFPEESPSLVHGDLWSGNLITNEKGAPCLIDPAVHYGHREAELAFTRLFGGFENEFYISYHEAFPVQPGFIERVDIYNLYPLLVHLNLFGSGYRGQIEAILDDFA